MILRSSLAKIVKRLDANAKFRQRWPATVQKQNGDDTLELLADDEAIRGYGLSGVVIRHGIPGMRVLVNEGSRCMLGFEGGDSSRPYAALWSEGSVKQILFNGGTSGVARLGDLVRITWPVPIDILAGTLNGQPFVATILIASPTVAQITTASERVLAGD